VKAFLKGYFPMHEPLHLRDFGRFEMNKRRLGRQREDRVLVAKEEINI
jgi:nucleoid DNA-binding protein